MACAGSLTTSGAIECKSETTIETVVGATSPQARIESWPQTQVTMPTNAPSASAVASCGAAARSARHGSSTGNHVTPTIAAKLSHASSSNNDTACALGPSTTALSARNAAYAARCVSTAGHNGPGLSAA